MKTFFLIIGIFFNHYFISAQTCAERTMEIDIAAKKSLAFYDQFFKSNEKIGYLETFILYPVLQRKYVNKKFRDTSLINKFEDLKRMIWCFDGLCLSNNKNYYLQKNEIISKIKSNEIADNYFRETVCALCNQYKLDSNQLKIILDFNDTTYYNKFSLLHKVLQLKNLNYNKCISKEIYTKYKTQLIDTICKLYINTKNVNDAVQNKSTNIVDFDIFSEAVLMISLLDDQPNISDELYTIILNTQNAAGVWQIAEQNVKSNEHTTLVALWLLLDERQKLKNLNIK